AHYMAIAESVEIPIMLYNVPSRTGVSLEPKTILELAKIPNIYAVKEASGNIERVVELNASNPNLRIFSGEDSLNYPILACGGAGMVSVTGNLLPKRIVALQRAMDSGNFEQARALNNALFPLNKALFLESNPIPIKAAMYIAGLLPRLEYRLPLVEPSKQTYDILQNLIQSYDEVQ
ncbi:MAG: dihydrodipicolinate synthase family protein, partial [Helicobacter sp.]|nr:dihydrodipicolinate synthase family protein [Helicobacter sp.]